MTGIRPADVVTPLPDGARRKRALWRAAHRGTKEMDLMLGRYAEARVPHMEEVEFAGFERLLELPDPDLQRWLLDPPALGDSEFATVVMAIRQFHGLPTNA